MRIQARDAVGLSTGFLSKGGEQRCTTTLRSRERIASTSVPNTRTIHVISRRIRSGANARETATNVRNGGIPTGTYEDK